MTPVERVPQLCVANTLNPLFTSSASDDQEQTYKVVGMVDTMSQKKTTGNKRKSVNETPKFVPQDYKKKNTKYHVRDSQSL